MLEVKAACCLLTHPFSGECVAPSQGPIASFCDGHVVTPEMQDLWTVDRAVTCMRLPAPQFKSQAPSRWEKTVGGWVGAAKASPVEAWPESRTVGSAR